MCTRLEDSLAHIPYLDDEITETEATKLELPIDDRAPEALDPPSSQGH